MNEPRTFPTARYHHQPQLHRNILVAALQFLVWMVFHHSAWGRYIQSVASELEPGFTLLSLRRKHLRSAWLWRLVSSGLIFWPILSWIVIVLIWGRTSGFQNIGDQVTNSLFVVLFIVVFVVLISLVVGVVVGMCFSFSLSIAFLLLAQVFLSIGPLSADYFLVDLAGLLILGTVATMGPIAFAGDLLGDGQLRLSVRGILYYLLGLIAFSILTGFVIVFVLNNIYEPITTWVLLLILVAPVASLLLYQGKIEKKIPVAVLLVIGQALIIGLMLTMVKKENANIVWYLLAVAFILAFLLGFLFGLPYRIVKQRSLAQTALLAGGMGIGFLLLLSDLITPDASFYWYYLCAPAGLLLAWLRPVIFYPFLALWNLAIYGLETRCSGRMASLFWLNSAFWDDTQVFPVPFFNRHMCLVRERYPGEWAQVVQYFTRGAEVEGSVDTALPFRWGWGAKKVRAADGEIPAIEAAEPIPPRRKGIFSWLAAYAILAMASLALGSVIGKEVMNSLTRREGYLPVTMVFPTHTPLFNIDMPVLAAARDIPAGKVLMEADVVTRYVGKSAVSPNNLLFGEPKSILGTVTNVPIPKGTLLEIGFLASTSVKEYSGSWDEPQRLGDFGGSYELAQGGFWGEHAFHRLEDKIQQIPLQALSGVHGQAVLHSLSPLISGPILHTGDFVFVKWLPDDRMMGITKEGEIRLVDLRKGEALGQFDQRIQVQQSDLLTVNPRAGLVAVPTAEKEVAVIDLVTRQTLTRIPVTGELVAQIEFSPRGRYLALNMTDPIQKQMIFQMWDLQEQRMIVERLATVSWSGINFLPDETVFLMQDSPEKANQYFLIRTQDGQVIMHQESLTSLTISTDGRYLVGYFEKTLQVFDARSGQRVSETVLDADVEEIKTGTRAEEITVATSSSRVALHLPDLRMVKTLWQANAYGAVGHVFDFEDRYLVMQIPKADGKGDRLVVWDMLEQSILHEIEEPLGGVSNAWINPALTRMEYRSDELGYIRVVDLHTKQILVDIFCDPNTLFVRAVCKSAFLTSTIYSPDGHFMATHSIVDGQVTLWDLDSGQKVLDLSNPDNPDQWTRIQFLEGGRLFAIVENTYEPQTNGAKVKHLEVWRLEELGVRTRLAVAGPVRQVDFSHGSQNLIVQTNQKQFEYSLPGGMLVQERDAQPAGQLPASGLEARVAGETAEIRAVTDGRLLRTITHGGSLAKVVISEDGRRAATLGRDGWLRIWNLDNGESLSAHRIETAPLAVAFASSGRYIATVDEKGWIRIRDASNGAVLAEIHHSGALQFLRFSPDEKYLASATLDGIVRVSLWRNVDWIQLLCTEYNLQLSRWESDAGKEASFCGPSN